MATNDKIRAVQVPLKQRYRDNPAAARVTSYAEARLAPGEVACTVTSRSKGAKVGLHSAAGGDGTLSCSPDLLLEALVACAAVTFQGIATSMAVPILGGTVRAEADWDARGTMGVSREAPAGLTAVRLSIVVESDAPESQLATLLEMTERLSIAVQTLKAGVPVEAVLARRSRT
jgi:uncharacterized OsmC-like protein